MNYIKEMNAFYEQIIFNPLSSSAIAVWHTLMHFNNKSGWQRTFSVPASLIELTSGVKGTTFKRARIELQEKGYIAVIPGSGNQAATYRMISQIKSFEQHDNIHTSAPPQSAESIHHAPYEPIQQIQVTHSTPRALQAATESATTQTKKSGQTNPLDRTRDHTMTINTCPENQMDEKANDTAVRTPVHNPSDNTVRMPVHNPDCTTDHNAAHTTDPLFKQYINKTNTKHKLTTTTSDAIHFYQKNFSSSGTYVLEDISQWITDMSEALVLDAMKRALEQNKSTWRYVKGILKSWKTKGITTVAEAAADDNLFRNKYAQKPASRLPNKDEAIPEWFKARKKKQAIERGQQLARPITESACTESEQEEFNRLLAEFSKTKCSESG